MTHVKTIELSTNGAKPASPALDGPVTHQQLVQALDAVDLTPIVRRALNQPSLVLTRWQRTQIQGGVGNGFNDTSVYRFNGQGQHHGQTVDWSVILKILSPRPAVAPSDPTYWRREVEAYRSGWLDELPGHLRAPRCLAVVDYPGQACLLWQEDVREAVGARWPLAIFGQAARHLGQFNAVYLLSGGLALLPWLSQSPPYDANRSAATMARLPGLAAQPLIHRMFPGDSLPRLERVWRQRATLRAELDHLPTTVCHFDAFRRNLFMQRDAGGGYHTVAIDWALAGRGAVGEDAAALAFLSLFFLEAEVSQAKDFENVVFAGYVEGLRDTGWRGSVAQVRLGYLSHFVLRWLELIRVVELYLDEDQHPFMEMITGHRYSIAELIDNYGALNQFTLSLADELLERLSGPGLSRSTIPAWANPRRPIAVWSG